MAGNNLITVIGNEEVKRSLNRLSRLQLDTLHADLGEEHRQQIEKRFDEGVNPLGFPWQRLARVYKRKKSSKITRGPTDIPLKSRRLFRSFEVDSNDIQADIGTRLLYAKYHTDSKNNSGAPRIKMPLREFMGLPGQQDTDVLLDITLKHIKKAA